MEKKLKPYIKINKKVENLMTLKLNNTSFTNIINIDVNKIVVSKILNVSLVTEILKK